MASRGFTVVIFGLLVAQCYCQETTPDIKVTTIAMRPYIMVSEVNVSGVVTTKLSGYIVEIMDKVSEAIGKSYKLELVKDERFGVDLQNGTWNGMIGELNSGKADMAAAPMTVTERRSEVVKFSMPFQVARLSLLLRKPEREDVTYLERVTYLLRPMSQMVWICIIIAYFLTSTVLYIIARCNPYGWRKLYKDGLATIREKESFDCSNTFWFTMSTLLWQGYVRSPRSVGARIATLAWWVFVAFTLIIYIASLTNMIRVGDISERTTRVRSFGDISRFDDVSISYIEGGATQRTIETSNIFPQLKEKSKPESPINNTSMCVDRLRQEAPGKHACVLESFFSRTLSGAYPCDLYTIENNHNIRFYSFAYSHKFKYADEIDRVLISLRNSGQLADLYKRFFATGCDHHYYEATSDDYYTPVVNENPHAISLASFSGALIFLCIGLVLGGIVTVIEVLVFKFVEAGPPLDEPVYKHSGNTGSPGHYEEATIKDPSTVETNV